MAWTAQKRKSVQGYMGALATPWPSAVSVGWRAAAAWLFAADSYPAATTTTEERERTKFAAGRAHFFAGRGIRTMFEGAEPCAA